MISSSSLFSFRDVAQ
jgi:Alcohol dehydrogenase GroES-like domain